jgi:hypothetical protein
MNWQIKYLMSSVTSVCGRSGLLVVNVTWRGKTYVGTLMDATKHHWAPPRSVSRNVDVELHLFQTFKLHTRFVHSQTDYFNNVH